ncbi:hypothetical protein, partial [Escherichia coli]|uniref:hypothetical protein n=1 Tax=Escherichia coli TaxID=562 RepID=UPI001BFD1BD2
MARFPSGRRQPARGFRAGWQAASTACPVSPVSAALKDIVTTEENRLLIRHKITDFINNLRG